MQPVAAARRSCGTPITAVSRTSFAARGFADVEDDQFLWAVPITMPTPRISRNRRPPGYLGKGARVPEARHERDGRGDQCRDTPGWPAKAASSSEPVGRLMRGGFLRESARYKKLAPRHAGRSRGAGARGRYQAITHSAGRNGCSRCLLRRISCGRRWRMRWCRRRPPSRKPSPPSRSRRPEQSRDGDRSTGVQVRRQYRGSEAAARSQFPSAPHPMRP